MTTAMKPAADYSYTENCVWHNVESAFVARFPSWTYYMSHLICFIFNVIQALLTIFLNYLAVHALCKSSQLRRKTTLFLVMVLSANDLAVGIIVESVFLFHLGREIYEMEDCFGSALKQVTLDLLPAISFTIFVVLNFEIYLSIMYPIFHKTKITNRRVLKILCITVMISIVRSYLFTFHVSERAATLFVTIFILLTLIALAFIHIKISVAVYKRRRIGFTSGVQSSHVPQSKSFLHGVREAKSCLLILFCTVFCYLPSAIEGGLEKNTFAIVLFNPWKCTSVLAASVLNCIVFFWRNGILRKEAKHIIHSFGTFFLHK
jgi:hypothetical protein